MKTNLSLMDRARGINVLMWLPRRTTYSALRCIQERYYPIDTDEPSGWKGFGDMLQRSWCHGLLRRSHTRVVLRGAGNINLDDNYIVVANHQSLFDVPCLVTALPIRLRFVAKVELRSVPMFGLAMDNLGHVLVDRSKGRKGFDQMAKDVLGVGCSVVIFPEGTRSADGTLGSFKSGAFYLAKETGLSILPVSVKGTYTIMPRWRIWLKTDQTVYVDVGEPISPTEGDPHSLRDKTWKAIRGLMGGE